MAKKKEVLTLEEKLEKVLVLDWEQPYKVPSNWVWTRLGEVYNLDTGNSINASVKEKKYMGIKEGLNYIATKDVGVNTKIEYDNGVKISDYDKFKIAKKDTALMCIEGGSAGKKIGYLDENVCFGNKLCTFDSKIENNKLLFYYLLSNEFIISFRKNHHGLIGGVSVAKLKTIEFPLPPLEEQKRIVERIGSLFAKLDEAKDIVQSALDSFEERKSAILHKAFSGELTKMWRVENRVGIDSWEEVSLNEIGCLERGKSKHRPRNDEKLFGGKYPFVQTGDIARANIYVVDHKQTLSEFGLAQSKLFSKGTLCITIAANIGDVAILSYDCCFPDSVVAFIPNEKSITKFIYYKMSILKNHIETNAPATAQKNINLKILGEILFLVPTIKEQKEIVHILDIIFEKEKEAKELANVLEQIDTMKKTILAKAFRGELGTNDESEESALRLLREILEER